MKKDCFTNGNKNHISNTVLLYNSSINILPKILPANQKIISKNISKDNLCLNENTNSKILKNISNNGTNIELHNIHTLNKERNNSLKIMTSQEKKEKKIDGNEFKKIQNDANHISSHSKFRKKSSEIVQELPQLRKTTPRLAKTRSAQNMKLMAQVLGPKALSSNNNTLKSREKNEMDTNLEKISTLPKIVSKIITFQ